MQVNDITVQPAAPIRKLEVIIDLLLPIQIYLIKH